MSLLWRGIQITENGSRELKALYDIADYAKALRDGIIEEPGVPQSVDPVIVEECRILLKTLEPFDTFHDL